MSAARGGTLDARVEPEHDRETDLAALRGRSFPPREDGVFRLGRTDQLAEARQVLSDVPMFSMSWK